MLAILMSVSVLWPVPATAALPSVMEYDLKAAYIHNFTKFVVWPAASFHDGASPLVIGVLGNESVATALAALVRGRQVNGRRIDVRHVRSPDDLAALHVLYVAAAQEAALEEAPGALSRSGLLTIGESDRFMARGGMIRFVVHDDRLLFEINVAAAQRAGVTASSQLLKLARSVHKTL